MTAILGKTEAATTLCSSATNILEKIDRDQSIDA